MSAFPRTSQSIEGSTESDDSTSPAMQAVHRAWRHQYSDLRIARSAASEAVALAEAANDFVALGHAHIQHAYAAIRLGEADAARSSAERSRAVFDDHGDERGLWLARTMQALCLRLDGAADRSIRALQDLEANPPRNATTTDIFVVHVALSLGYRFIGLLEPALKWHYRAVDTARRTGDQLLLASTLCNLGGYHSDLYNAEEGCRLLEEGLRLASACNADRTTVIIALNLTQAYAALGRHEEALALAEAYLPLERYRDAIGGDEPSVPLTLALAYANAGRPIEAQRVYEDVRDQLVRSPHDDGTPQVFWTYVESRIALVAQDPARAAHIALSTLNEVDEHTVDSPSDLMQLHATAARACEAIGDDRRALVHERSRAAIRERLAHLAAHVAGLTHTIRSELDTTRAERDRIVKLHAELEREHERLATLNQALTLQIAENMRLHEELKEQNDRDALTGLHNRRFLYERGPRLLEASLLNHNPLCLVMLDLDHFKRLNDAHGHMVGDRVLIALGRLLRDGLRENDIVCRVGGEEFAMVLPTTTAPTARERLQRLLDACRQMQGPDGEDALPSDLTFSAGIAEAPADGVTIDQLMIAADRLLYRAKHNGRARIEGGLDGARSVTASLAARETVE